MMSPATLTPLKDSPNVVATSVEQSIAWLKVTFETSVTATPVAPFTGLVDTTVGGEPLPLPLAATASRPEGQLHKSCGMEPQPSVLQLAEVGARLLKKRLLARGEHRTGGSGLTFDAVRPLRHK